MRLIDADALYRKVKTECNPYGKPTIGFEDGNRVMNWIEQAPTVSGWISVEDRLPEEHAEEHPYEEAETLIGFIRNHEREDIPIEVWELCMRLMDEIDRL